MRVNTYSQKCEQLILQQLNQSNIQIPENADTSSHLLGSCMQKLRKCGGPPHYAMAMHANFRKRKDFQGYAHCAALKRPKAPIANVLHWLYTQCAGSDGLASSLDAFAAPQSLHAHTRTEPQQAAMTMRHADTHCAVLKCSTSAQCKCVTLTIHTIHVVELRLCTDKKDTRGIRQSGGSRLEGTAIPTRLLCRASPIRPK